MATASEADKLAAATARCVDATRAWRDAFGDDGVAAAVGASRPTTRDDDARDDDDDDARLRAATSRAARDAAPFALAIERHFAARATEEEDDEEHRGDRGGIVVVEACAPSSSRGHALGLVLASALPRWLVREVVLVDARWPSSDAKKEMKTNDTMKKEKKKNFADEVPTSHVDAFAASHPRAAPVSRWRGNLRNASHLRSLRDALANALSTKADDDAARGVAFVCARADGLDALRLAQLFHATVDVSDSARAMLAMAVGEPPDLVAGARGKVAYRAGESHLFSARELSLSRLNLNDDDDDGGGQRKEEDAARGTRRAFAAHVRRGLTTRDGVEETFVVRRPGAFYTLVPIRPRRRGERRSLRTFPVVISVPTPRFQYPPSAPFNFN